MMNKKTKSIPYFPIIVFGLCIYCFIDFVFVIGKGIKRTSSLNTEPKKTIKAYVIPEKHFLKRKKADFVFKYLFYLNGQEYRGICPDESYAIGDTILVDYTINNPNFSIVHTNPN